MSIFLCAELILEVINVAWAKSNFKTAPIFFLHKFLQFVPKYRHLFTGESYAVFLSIYEIICCFSYFTFMHTEFLFFPGYALLQFCQLRIWKEKRKRGSYSVGVKFLLFNYYLNKDSNVVILDFKLHFSRKNKWPFGYTNFLD